MITVSNITKSYLKNRVLDGISFKIDETPCTGIIGHNGSGKSTLLSILAGVVSCDSGEVFYDNETITANFLKMNLGYLPQDDSLFYDLTVKDNIAYWKALLHITKNPQIFYLLGVEALLNKKVSELSGGMRKRVSIAISLLNSPKYLILDEPFNGIDAEYVTILQNYLLEYKKCGTTIIICSHKPKELKLLCDELIVLTNGKISDHCKKQTEIATFLSNYLS